MRAWEAAGVSLPHNAAMQYETVAHITFAQLRPGDLIFYYSPIHHVAIYIGGGNIIQASQPGRPVAIAKYDGSPITGYGRPADMVPGRTRARGLPALRDRPGRTGAGHRGSLHTNLALG